MKNNLMKTQVNIKIGMFLQKEVHLIVGASDQNISTERQNQWDTHYTLLLVIFYRKKK